jgi:hypothetical protein
MKSKYPIHFKINTTLYDQVCQLLTTGWWFSPGTPVSSNNKTDSHDITEILLKVALNAINQPNGSNHFLTARICVNFPIHEG